MKWNWFYPKLLYYFFYPPTDALPLAGSMTFRRKFSGVWTLVIIIRIINYIKISKFEESLSPWAERTKQPYSTTDQIWCDRSDQTDNLDDANTLFTSVCFPSRNAKWVISHFILHERKIRWPQLTQYWSNDSKRYLDCRVTDHGWWFISSG